MVALAAAVTHCGLGQYKEEVPRCALAYVPSRDHIVGADHEGLCPARAHGRGVLHPVRVQAQDDGLPRRRARRLVAAGPLPHQRAQAKLGAKCRLGQHEGVLAVPADEAGQGLVRQVDGDLPLQATDPWHADHVRLGREAHEPAPHRRGQDGALRILRAHARRPGRRQPLRKRVPGAPAVGRRRRSEPLQRGGGDHAPRKEREQLLA